MLTAVHSFQAEVRAEFPWAVRFRVQDQTFKTLLLLLNAFDAAEHLSSSHECRQQDMNFVGAVLHGSGFDLSCCTSSGRRSKKLFGYLLVGHHGVRRVNSLHSLPLKLEDATPVVSTMVR